MSHSPLAPANDLLGIRRNAIAVSALWTGVIMASLAFYYYGEQAITVELATREAITSIDKDLALRRWVSLHGGVYVPADEHAPPSQYLAAVPEREVVTTSGKKLTLIDPTDAMRRVYEQLSDDMAARGHLTSLSPLNPANAADPWEAKALQSFAAGAEGEIMQVAYLDGKPFLKAIRPLKTEASCLKCHGEQGFQLGAVQGGLCATVQLEPYLENQSEVFARVGLGHGFIWLLGIFAIGYITHQSERRSHERQTTAQALISSEEKFSTAFESSPEPIVIARIDNGVILEANESFIGFSGYGKDELIGKTTVELGFWETPTFVYHFAWRSENQTKIKDVELKMRVKSGEIRTVLVSASTIKLEDHKCLLCLIRDVTEQRRIEIALREAAKLNDQIINSAQEGIVVFDRELRFQLWNPYMERLTGHFAYEVLGQNLEERFPNMHALGVIEAARRSLKGETVTLPDQCAFVKKTGREIWFSHTSMPLRDPEGMVIGSLNIVNDVSERKRQEDQISLLAHHDALTFLPNRTLLNHRLGQALSQAKRNRHKLAVLFIDLDRFKNINDSLGHPAGDALLRTIAERLSNIVRLEDTVCRLGGDEFIILLAEIHRDEDAALVAMKISESIVEPFSVQQHELRLTASIGISLFPDDAADADALLQNADTAMYQAKDRGRNNYQFFTPDMNKRAMEALAIEHSLRRSIERNEFVVYYQPQIDIASNTIIGMEALVRWMHPEKGLVLPGKFIAIAEERGLIAAIGEWVLKAVCTQISEWMQAGLPLVPVAVNISATQFHQANMTDKIMLCLDQAGVPPSLIELELTESIVMTDADASVLLVNQLATLGLKLSIDDFGTGYSSLSYLRRFPIHKLKIDRSFIMDINTDQDDEAIVTSIIALGKSLGLMVIAEGVETTGQLDFLRKHGCDEAQGYLFSEPLPADLMAERLRRLDREFA